MALEGDSQSSKKHLNPPHVTGTSVLKDKQVPRALGAYARDLPWMGEAKQASLEVTLQL